MQLITMQRRPTSQKTAPLLTLVQEWADLRAILPVNTELTCSLLNCKIRCIVPLPNWLNALVSSTRLLFLINRHCNWSSFYRDKVHHLCGNILQVGRHLSKNKSVLSLSSLPLMYSYDSITSWLTILHIYDRPSLFSIVRSIWHVFFFFDLFQVLWSSQTRRNILCRWFLQTQQLHGEGQRSSLFLFLIHFYTHSSSYVF